MSASKLNQLLAEPVFVCEEDWSALRDEMVDMHKRGIDVATFAKNNPDKMKALENKISITWLDPLFLKNSGRSLRTVGKQYETNSNFHHEMIPYLEALVSGQDVAKSRGSDRILSTQGDTFQSSGFFLTEDWSRVLTVSKNLTQFESNKAEVVSIAREMIQVIETANAPIFGVDSQGRVNEWNQSAAAITGFQKSDVLGRGLVTDFITDAHRESVKRVLDKALAGEETANYEFPLYAKSGKKIDILLNASTRRDANGTIVGVIGIGQDLTELNLAKAQLIQASKMSSLGEMSTCVAHELNQPLQVIQLVARNCADRIELKTAAPEYIGKQLRNIEAQVSRISEIVNHMRMFGREAGEPDEIIDPRKSMVNSLALMRGQLEMDGIEVVVGFDFEGPGVTGHAVRLEQVFLNILTNARDAILKSGAHKGRKITITSIPVDGDQLEISINDTGGGIPDHLLGRIFEPFFTTKEVGKGTGVGLSVSYGIVRDMGGIITVGNIAGGSRFVITLPTV